MKKILLPLFMFSLLILAVLTANGCARLNQPPTITLTAQPLEGEAPLKVDFTAVAKDPNSKDVLTLNWTFGDGTAKSNGNPTESHTYQNEGTYTAKVTVSDNKGGVASASVTITVTGTDIKNDPPVAQSDSVQVELNTSTLIDVLANDSDPDGDTLTIQGFTQGAHGTVSVEGDQICYTPSAGFTGSDNFTYTISDGNGGTATAPVSVNVVDSRLVLQMDINEDSGTTGKIQFEITQPGTYEIKTSFYMEDCDTVIYVYDSDQVKIAENDDISDSNLYSCISLYLNPGTHYVQVEELCFQPLYCHLEVRRI